MTQLIAPPIMAVMPPSLVAPGHQSPNRKGKVKADAIKLNAMVTIHKMAAGGLMATSRASTPITRVT